MKKAKLLSMILVSILSLGLFACSKEETLYKTSSEGAFAYENATVYFAMTDRFYDGTEKNNNAYGRKNPDELGKSIGTFNGGDILGLTKKLEEGYFQDLGVNAIWITAPYEQIHGYIGGGERGDFAHYGFHGYYALDWTMMDRNIGTVEEFRTFVDTAHSQGIRIIMDVVMNHVGYPNLSDMLTYGYGNVDLPEGYEVKEGMDFFDYTKYVDYTSASSFENYWGDWVRADLPGYEEPGESEITLSLAGLPDVRTEVEVDLGLPPILERKWSMETGEEDEKYIIPAAKDLRQDLGLPPYAYITKWLTAFVEEFGIDGFRVDTAKHVEVERWANLKVEAQRALERFREMNPDKPGADFKEEFFMMAEVWGHGVLKDYYFNHGFDAVINFAFQGLKKDGPAFRASSMANVYENYAKTLHGEDPFNVLSYLSQHDTVLYPREKLIEGATKLLLLPGAVKIFYGDETARPLGDGGSDSTQGTRSFMNWDSVDEEVLSHFQKLGTFRNRNISVGAGIHETLSKEPFIFTRTYDKNGLLNRVLVYEGPGGEVEIDLQGAFPDGTVLRDAYANILYEVKDGKVKLQVDEMGLSLLEAVEKVGN
jgi:alpha-amylase